MIFDRLKEFRSSYDDCGPTQDNEGFCPDRGSFKMGFFAACNKLQPLLQSDDATSWDRVRVEALQAELAAKDARIRQLETDRDRLGEQRYRDWPSFQKDHDALRARIRELEEAIELATEQQGMQPDAYTILRNALKSSRQDSQVKK